MIAPDEVPLWLAIPASVLLCLVWRRQVVAERKRTIHNEQEQR